jgi:hypothetical protein
MMKSCFGCVWCCDVDGAKGEETFRCSIPLPPWRFRHDDGITVDREWCHVGDAYVAIPSGDKMAEHCHHYKAKG